MTVLITVNVTAFILEENPKENNGSFPLHWLLIIAGVLVLVFTAVSVIYCSYKKHKKSMFALMKYK